MDIKDLNVALNGLEESLAVAKSSAKQQTIQQVISDNSITIDKDTYNALLQRITDLTAQVNDLITLNPINTVIEISPVQLDAKP